MQFVIHPREFNTGRMYAADGQRIVWAVVELPVELRTERGNYTEGRTKRVVIFNDTSRGITGQIELHFGNLDLVNSGWVLRAYDDMHYTHVSYEHVREMMDALTPKEGNRL